MILFNSGLSELPYSKKNTLIRQGSSADVNQQSFSGVNEIMLVYTCWLLGRYHNKIFPELCVLTLLNLSIHIWIIYIILMHRCFGPWTETAMWVLAEFLCANVILLKIMPVTVSGTTSDKYSSTILLGNMLQTGRKKKSILMNDNSPLASPL